MTSLASFQSLPLYAPPGVLVVLTLIARGPESRCTCTWQWYLFFFLLAFLLEVLLAGKGFGSFGTKRGGGFLTGLLQGSQIEEACNLATVELANWLPQEQHQSISHRIDDGCRLAFTSVSIAFLMSPSQLSYPRIYYSIWVFIDGLRLLQKNQIRLDSSWAPFSSNS